VQHLTMNKIGLLTKWCDHHGSDLWSSGLSENCCLVSRIWSISREAENSY